MQPARGSARFRADPEVPVTVSRVRSVSRTWGPAPCRCDRCDTWSMTTVEEVLEWVAGHADALTQEMTWHPGSIRGGWWDAADPQAKSRIRARATAALAFVERFTGSDSRWSENAHRVFDSHGENQSMPSGARAVGDMLREWTNMVRSGQATPRLVEHFSARTADSTDLLEQVRRLNSDEAVAPAAPIVLAGAAL